MLDTVMMVNERRVCWGQPNMSEGRIDSLEDGTKKWDRIRMASGIWMKHRRFMVIFAG